MRIVFLSVILVVLSIVVGGSISVAGSLPGELDRKTLAGLPGVGVVLEEVKPPLDTSTIQTDVELRLRRAGIRVLSEEERQKTTGGPYLYVQVTHIGAVAPWGNIVAYSLNVELKQNVFLERTYEAAVGSTTWSVSSVAIVGRNNLVKGVREAVRDHVDKFINTYLSVHPDIKPAPEPDVDEDTPPKKKKTKKKSATE
jgi:hypothetical protein